MRKILADASCIRHNSVLYLICFCRCVGIGRRGGLKIHCQRWRAGSSPATGTSSEIPTTVPFPASPKTALWWEFLRFQPRPRVRPPGNDAQRHCLAGEAADGGISWARGWGGLSSGIFFVNARQKKSGPFLASISHKISHGFCASLYGSCSFILLSWHGRYQKGADPQKQGPRFHFITKSGSYCARSSSRQSPQAPFAS